MLQPANGASIKVNDHKEKSRNLRILVDTHTHTGISVGLSGGDRWGRNADVSPCFVSFDKPVSSSIIVTLTFIAYCLYPMSAILLQVFS